MLTVGVDSCKKEDDQKNALWWLHNGSDLSYEEEEEDPDAIRAEAEKSYQEAFDAIKQNKNYDLAVEKLTKAAKANVDSSNMFLAYMYEYGVGVKQDIEKAKEYYARETAINGNEFANEKLASLNDKSNNYKIVLPEGCKLKMNDIAVVNGDTINIVNGDGTFKTSSHATFIKNTENKLVSISYRHPSTKGTTNLDALESAVTLMLCYVPYAFELDEKTYNIVRSQLLAMEETRELAKEIENQLKDKGGFDYESLIPFMLKGCNAIYESVDTPKKTLSKSSKTEIGAIDANGELYSLNSCISLSPAKKQEITTSFKSGTYHPDEKYWDVTLNVRNSSSLPFMAVPGTADETGFHEKDFFSNFRFVACNGDVAPMKSATGWVRGQVNYLSLMFDVCFSDDYNYGYWTSASEGIHDLIGILGTASQNFREQYLSVEREVDIQLKSDRDLVRYYYPFCGTTDNDYYVDAYYIIFNLTIPIYESISAYSKVKSAINAANGITNIVSNPSIKQTTAEDIVADIVYGLMKDDEWRAGLYELRNIISLNDYSKLNTELVASFLFNTVNTIIEETWNAFCDDTCGENKKKIMKKGATESAKISQKVYEKGWTSDNILDIVESAETVADQFVPIMVVATTTASIANKATGLISGLFDRFMRDYIPGMAEKDFKTFDVKFLIKSKPLITLSNIFTTVTVGTPAMITATTDQDGDITMLVNDVANVTKTDQHSLTYDLSKLSPGTYKIKFKVICFPLVAETEEFTCVVKSAQTPITNPLTISCTPVTSATVGTTANVTASANKNCNITLLVNGTTKTTASNKTSLTYDLSQLSPGTYEIKFKAVVDSETAETQEFTCVVNEQFVPLSITSTTAGVATKGDITNVTATANKNATIKMYVDGSVYSSVYNKTSMTYNLSELSVGTHYIKFRAEVGSESAETREFQCTVDNPTFNVSISAYVDAREVSEIDYQTLVEFVAVANRDCVMDLYIDGKLVRQGSSTSHANVQQRLYATDNLSSGPHTIKVYASEQYGNAFDEITINVKSTQSYDYIDLGLPSGTLWATCNVGAGNPWEYGELLESEEDPATLKMGSNWRLPTQNEYRELAENCNLQWTTDYNGTGVKGLIVTSKKYTNKHIFLPVKGSYGTYWSSTKDWYHEGYYYFFQFVDNYTNYDNAQLRAPKYGLYGRAVRN